MHGDIDTNNPDSDYYNGHDTALTLDIEANAKVEKHTCEGYRKGDSTETSITVDMKLDIPKIKEAGIEFTGKKGKTIYISKDESIKVSVYNPVVAQEVGVKAELTFNSEADSSAFADFDFNEHDLDKIEFDEGTVWYDAP